MKPFDRLESEVRSYCRSFPVVFTKSQGCTLQDESGARYLDFFAGAGALNYGHNPPAIKAKLVDYLTSDGVTHSLDMMTTAKRGFLEAVEERMLLPRALPYKVMMPGPTGTNAVEAALKLARKATGRANVVSFTNGFHGMTLGALAVTGNAGKRGGAGLPLGGATPLPYYGDLSPGGCESCPTRTDACCTLDWMERMLTNPSSGVDKPAAVIVECIQGEGGARAASAAWLRGVRKITQENGILLIVDDIQAGCGRSGDLFSFEEAGIVPDIVTLSKSLSGMGLPFAAVLLKPELDVFRPGEHNGTFRGFNPAFITAAAALHQFWSDDTLSRHVKARSAQARARLTQVATKHGLSVVGRGLMLGLRFPEPALASATARECFQNGLLIETSGAHDEVLKLLPPLVITEAELDQGLDIIDAAVATVCAAPVETAGMEASP